MCHLPKCQSHESGGVSCMTAKCSSDNGWNPIMTKDMIATTGETCLGSEGKMWWYTGVNFLLWLYCAYVEECPSL